VQMSFIPPIWHHRKCDWSRWYG